MFSGAREAETEQLRRGGGRGKGGENGRVRNAKLLKADITRWVDVRFEVFWYMENLQVDIGRKWKEAYLRVIYPVWICALCSGLAPERDVSIRRPLQQRKVQRTNVALISSEASTLRIQGSQCIDIDG